MELPNVGRLIPIRLRVTEEAGRIANEFGPSVTGQVGESWRFVVGDAKRNMSHPMAPTLLWIFIPRSVFARKTNDKNVRPTIAIEIIREGEKVFRVGIVDTQSPFETRKRLFDAVCAFAFEGLVGCSVFVSSVVVRPLIPIRAANDVTIAVTIKVIASRAFSPKLIGERFFSKRVEIKCCSQTGGRCSYQRRDEQNQVPHTEILWCQIAKVKRAS